MADFSDKYGIVFQNLVDAGCDSAFAEEYARLILDGKEQSVLKDFGEHRKKLLDEIHINQKRIDCLDYLIYKIEKSEL